MHMMRPPGVNVLLELLRLNIELSLKMISDICRYVYLMFNVLQLNKHFSYFQPPK